MSVVPGVKTYLNYIGGEWVPSESGELITSYDPATQEVVAYAQKSTILQLSLVNY